MGRRVESFLSFDPVTHSLALFFDFLSSQKNLKERLFDRTTSRLSALPPLPLSFLPFLRGGSRPCLQQPRSESTRGSDASACRDALSRSTGAFFSQSKKGAPHVAGLGPQKLPFFAASGLS